MAWIESHQSLSRHRKLLRAATILGVDRHKLIGHLHELWWWGLDNVPVDGQLEGLSDSELAAAAEWDGDAAAFMQALTSAGFVDVDGEGQRWLHNWYKYAGKLLNQRTANAERMRRARAGHMQDTSGARAPATVPNPTVPNLKERSDGREPDLLDKLSV